MNTLSKRETLSIGLMLFALFFGAGNMIFPPALGQASGSQVWAAMAGFIITGVGLPLLGVVAIGLSGGNLQTLASRVHPVFGIILTVVVYLTIGPIFAIPRTSTVAYEIGVVPFLFEGVEEAGFPLFIFSVLFFLLTYWLALNPSKLVDRVGKILTPILLTIIVVLFISSLIEPVGPVGIPVSPYKEAPFFEGFMEGYLTMDALAALVFGIVAVTAAQERGVTDRRSLAWSIIKAGMIAAVGLGSVYLILAYLGSTSQVLGLSDNGGEVLTNVVQTLFGPAGSLLLGSAVTVACLTTSVGLVTACGIYFSKLFPSISYKQVVVAVALFSMGVANLGLTQIIAVSVPVLAALYPLAIVLILLTFTHQWFRGARSVYVGAMLGTGLVSLADGLKAFQVDLGALEGVYSWLPLYEQGVGWLLPALLGALIGFFAGGGKQKDSAV
ncbi:branched-chain amino acid transport system II carrier protein [Paludifilum halophilum]|uniref:Branched-chain amino acid transport system carrier protein n=1 Tax=Paludifilum halophilum TaxID=1642702 RepID=A0A235B1U4_9BACL|nr:branched-chain amino acid transport system II carrier protein [Paludifilum halophilum]OYD06278.1 branched-chain amino acid transport system II carrier protein [Paludifilum halophilum]